MFTQGHKDILDQLDSVTEERDAALKRVAELKQQLGGALIRLKELGDTEFEIPALSRRTTP